MAETLHLPPELRKAILDHCRAAFPREGCGLFAVSGSVVTAVYPTGNDAEGTDRFTVPPAEHHAALVDAEGLGWELGGSFHSHPRGEAVPSARDITGALDPGWIYLVVGRAEDLRAWRIAAGEASEIRLS